MTMKMTLMTDMTVVTIMMKNLRRKNDERTRPSK